MTNVVLLGGNGYIGRNATQLWMKKDQEAQFYVVSRSGKNQLKDGRIHNIQADIQSVEDIKSKLPEKVDYIVNFIGSDKVPEGSSLTLDDINVGPAKVMNELAKYYHVKAQGAIAGKLGSKDFVSSKKRMSDYLNKSDIPAVIVNPTLVYGNGRKDSYTRFVPFLKFFGIFSKNLKPMKVEDVVYALVTGMLKY